VRNPQADVASWFEETAGSCEPGSRRTAAILHPFTGTCKHQAIDPFAHLRDTLRRLPPYRSDQLEERLPDIWFASHPSARRTRAA